MFNFEKLQCVLTGLAQSLSFQNTFYNCCNLYINMLYNVSMIDLSNTAAKCKASNYVLLANVSKTLFSTRSTYCFISC